jgi:NAD(P)H-flavin reductase/hemoglobin-like flavoprotein
VDENRLKDSFARVAAHGDAVALFFYSDLFLRQPELRDMFPLSMSAQRDRLLTALGQIVSDVGNVDSLVPFLQDLGRDHRKFGTIAGHYPAVGVSLLATLRHFSGSDWTPDLAEEWEAAYGVIASVMASAAQQEEAAPAWWDAQLISHERRSLEVAVLRLVPARWLPYLPGQSVALEVPQFRPRVWRYYSMANAPRDDGTLDFHIRMNGGGQVSPALIRGLQVGTHVRLGPPVGTFTLDPQGRRDILLVAGGTGLAPAKALIEQLASQPRRTHLIAGGRDADDLYDLPHLEKMAVAYPWLTVTWTAASGNPGPHAEAGTVTDILARAGTWRDHDAYVSGPSTTVTQASNRLTELGVPQDQIHVEDFGWSET